MPAISNLKSKISNALLCRAGGKGIRTPDIQLAKLALYQLSYAPGKIPGKAAEGISQKLICGLFVLRWKCFRVSVAMTGQTALGFSHRPECPVVRPDSLSP